MAWFDWESLAGVLTSGPGVSSWGPGRLDVFVRGTDSRLYHKWFENGWNDWEPLGGVLTSAPSPASWGSGRIDVFARGVDSQLYHKWFENGWNDWEALGGILMSEPAACSWGPGRLDVFARGTDSQLYHKWFENGWSDWESLGGILTSGPGAASWGSGRIDVFAAGVDSALEHKWFENGWSDWESLGGVLSSSPGACSWGSGRIDVFAAGVDSALQHKWFENGWSDWESLGSVLTSAPSAVSWGPDRIDVFSAGRRQRVVASPMGDPIAHRLCAPGDLGPRGRRSMGPDHARVREGGQGDAGAAGERPPELDLPVGRARDHGSTAHGRGLEPVPARELALPPVAPNVPVRVRADRARGGDRPGRAERLGASLLGLFGAWEGLAPTRLSRRDHAGRRAQPAAASASATPPSTLARSCRARSRAARQPWRRRCSPHRGRPPASAVG